MKNNRVVLWVKEHKKQSIIIGIALVLLIVGGYLFYRLKIANSVERTDPSTTEAAEVSATVPSPLTGVQVSPAEAARPVTAVVIENSPDARPQSGLEQAGVVYEAIAEGGITRFLALYQEARPALFGPVRSLRPYFIDWGWPYDAAFAHVGGSGQALAEAKALNLRDLDQFSNANSYYRSGDRFAPHNVYTTSDLLDELEASKGFGESPFSPWARKDASPKEVPDATDITANISSFTYKANFKYDAGTNKYLRYLADQPHKDRETGIQISPDVVLILEMGHSLHADGQHTVINSVGSGTAHVFQDGTYLRGTWNKSARNEMFVFKDETGEAIPLNAGRTWVTIIPTTQSVEIR